MPDQEPIIPQPFWGGVIRSAGMLAFRLFGGLTVLGAENVPQTGPVLICPNHLSDADPLAIYISVPRRDVYFVAKHELFEIPLFGAAMRAFGTIAIHRETADRAAIRRAVDVLAQGSVLVVFPEGHISESGGLDRLLPGAALIAARAQAELTKSNAPALTIIPAGLSRTNWFLPYGAPMVRRSRLPARVVFGKSLDLDSLTSGGEQLKPIARVIGAVEHEIRLLTGQ